MPIGSRLERLLPENTYANLHPYTLYPNRPPPVGQAFTDSRR